MWSMPRANVTRQSRSPFSSCVGVLPCCSSVVSASRRVPAFTGMGSSGHHSAAPSPTLCDGQLERGLVGGKSALKAPLDLGPSLNQSSASLISSCTPCCTSVEQATEAVVEL